MTTLFLLSALSLPPMFFTRPPIVSYHAMTDEEMAERIKKIHDFEEVFVHDNPQDELFKKHHWERYPAEINGKKVWIRRKPAKDDAPKHRAIGASA